MVNGQRVPYIRNSRHNARRAARLLTEHASFPVTAAGVIAVMGAHKGFRIRAQPADGAVVVVTRRRIGHHPVAIASLVAARGRCCLRHRPAIDDVLHLIGAGGVNGVSA